MRLRSLRAACGSTDSETRMKPLFKTTKHSKTFEMKLQPNSAAAKHDVYYLVDDQRLTREDFLAALQVAEAMSR